MRYQEEAVKVNRKIYSQDLSKSLAAFETEQAIKMKDLEIENEKQKTKIYTIASILVGVLLVLSLFFLVRIKKQSQALKEKNKIIDESLKEKELLIKEVHHRVKNNFQIVSSLLELQSKNIEDEKAKELANDGKNRVKSMALIHQRLYQNETGLINFELYIKELIKEISSIYKIDKNVDLNIDVENLSFDVDTAIPLGLIVNELITNAYKYAFANVESPELEVSINKKEHQYSLVVKDNGKGINPNIDVSKVKSLGLRLVHRLTKQLQGSLIVNSKDGTTFNVLFKNTYQRKMID